ncbi:hypothetical protein FQN57_004147 [Myotisia sp. PD_48]|nr:hypothetical protein FQN57_004147 [Myotisia sp. PD_48]
MARSLDLRVLLALLLCISISLVHAEPLYHRKLQKHPRDVEDGKPTLLHSLTYRLFSKKKAVRQPVEDFSIAAVDSVHAVDRYKLIKRQGSGIITNSTPTTTVSESPTNTESLPISTPGGDSSTDIGTSGTPPSSTDVSTPPTTDSGSVSSPSPTPTTTTTRSTTSSIDDDDDTTTTSSTKSSTRESSSDAPSTTEEPTPTTSTSSTITGTTTNDDGSVSTYTSVVVVYPTPSGSRTDGEEPSRSGTGRPGLQSDAASATIGIKKEMLAMLGGAVALAMAL